MSFCGFSRPHTQQGLHRRGALSRGISATADSDLIIINPACADFFCVPQPAHLHIFLVKRAQYNNKLYYTFINVILLFIIRRL